MSRIPQLTTASCPQKQDRIQKMFAEGQDYIIIWRQKLDRIVKMFAEGQDYIIIWRQKHDRI